jgi:putative spermidine/putrescine transport system substrate-binding protein
MKKNQLRRRAVQATGLIAIAVIALTGCRSADTTAGEGDPGSLSINSFGGTFQEAIEKNVIAPYEEESGTTVDVTTAISSEALTQLRADSSAFDVAYMDLAVIAQAKAAGLLQPLDLDSIPNSEELYPLAVDEDGYWVAELTSMTGLAYNTDKVTEPPTSWSDLWDDKYAGHVAISNVAGTVGYQFLIEAAKLNGGSESDIDPGFAAIEELKPNLVSIYNTPDEMSRLLSSGEAWIGPWYADRTGALKATGAPVAFVQPEEGAIAVISAMVIPKDAINVEGANDFINFQLAADVNSRFMQATGNGPTNSTVELPQSYLDANYVPYGEEQIASLQQFDPEVISTDLSGWITRWTEEIAN